MKQAVEFEECLKDSPCFRLQVEHNEHDIILLEGLLEKMVKLCNGMVDAGQTFNTATRGLVGGIENLAKHFSSDKLVSGVLKKFACVLSELQSYLTIMLDQAHKTIASTLGSFTKDEIKKVKDTKKVFDRISDDLDNALHKNAQLPKTCKPSEAEEAKNILTAMHSCFSHTALDYAFQINILQSRKRIEVLDTMLKFMHIQSTYYHQGYDLTTDLDSYLKRIGKEMESVSLKFTVEKKDMEERHTLVLKKEESGALGRRKDNDPSGVVMEGYLFKRSSSAFKTWQRRFFTVQKNQLVYQKRSKDDQTVLAEDLRLCKVRLVEDLERRFLIEIVSPTKSWYLQADTESLRQDWLQAMQASIDKAFSDTMADLDTEAEPVGGGLRKAKSLGSLEKLQTSMSILDLVRGVPGNDSCAECGRPDPTWASTNLGIVLCINCSGIHRSLGVHVSKVRSLTLDAWEPESLKLMSEMGNSLVNRVYEAKYHAESRIKKPTPDCTRSEREAWIKAKYIHHKFVSLDQFLRNFQSLDKSIVRNLARMKIYHEEKDAKSNTKVKHLLKRKRGIKLSKAEKRKSAPDGIRSFSDPFPERLYSSVSKADEKKTKNLTENGGQANAPRRGSNPLDRVFDGDGEEEHSRLRSASLSEEIFSQLDGFRDRAESSSDSVPSEESVSSSVGEASGEFDEDAELREDRVKAINVLKSIHPNRLLYKAAEWKNLPLMSAAVAEGAKLNWVNEDDDNKTALHQSILGGSLAACEFLLQNGAKINLRDKRGRGALHHAALLGQTGQTCLFLKRGGNQHAVDENGEDPLTIALKQTNADIVTLLRLARLNDEMKESEEFMIGMPGDVTFTDVFRDFSNMASSDPDRLKRKFSTDPDRQTPV